MLKAATVDFDTELPAFTIGNERVTWLGALIKAARDDYRPRNFGERHLVDDLAVSRWRILRVALMEKAVYDAQGLTYSPRDPRDFKGRKLMPHEDICHLAMANLPEAHGTLLAALSRLDGRFRREFCAFLRLLTSLRNGSGFSREKGEATPAATQSLSTINTPNKENPPCEPSPNAPQTM